MSKIEIAPSNYDKLTTARKRLVRAMGELASSGVEFDHLSGLLEGFQGLTQSLTELIENCDVVNSGKGRPRKDNDNDIGEALEDDPRSDEEIAADKEMMESALSNHQRVGMAQ